VLEEHGLDPVEWPSELLWGDVTLVPSCPELEPIAAPPRNRAPARHIGPLYWDPPNAAPRFPPAPESVARVYVTIGSGGMITPKILEQVMRALSDPGLSVFVSAGIAPPTSLTPRGNLTVGGFTGLTEALRWSDVVLSHGGYSTVVAAHSQGRPQVVLPLMSEQEANGRAFVEKLGCGLLVRRTTTEGEGERLRFVDRRGEESDDPVPSRDDIRMTVEEVLEDGDSRRRAEEMSRQLAAAREAIDLPGLVGSAHA
jgi:UDP:flavonoid glycosyltransferase YjiC (YdhE family)